ncbi:MAG TPA: protein kinase [Pyrinomonadaceae bacterium]|nr:protein kinase [Pyrinomonadaceae bacterium]
MDQLQLAENAHSKAKGLDLRWQELCRRYLPLTYKDSIWRFSRESLPNDPDQGWKLHIAATVLNAPDVLDAVGPFFQRRGILYKAPRTLSEINNLNSGIHYGYCQVGKFLTVYPECTDEARKLARMLHQLTRRFSGPSIPFDLRYQPDSCVFYRYGAFKRLTLPGEKLLQAAIRNPKGELVPDTRDSAPKPGWVTDLFPASAVASAPKETLLNTTFKAFRALAQRGKGGVYQAVDFSATPPRFAVLKEGRKLGEIGWDGRDGFWRVQHEERVLSSLRKAGVNVPRLYSSFIAEANQYLALEFIEGGSFEEYLIRRQRRLRVSFALKLGIRIAELLAQIHQAGWVWRDCKPRNLILTKNGGLRPLDFEGACRVDEPDPEPWGTPCYVPPEWHSPFCGKSRLPEDLYALGATIFMLFAGHPPQSRAPSLHKYRRNVPPGVVAIIRGLLDSCPESRPSAQSVAHRLQLELHFCSKGLNESFPVYSVKNHTGGPSRRNSRHSDS